MDQLAFNLASGNLAVPTPVPTARRVRHRPVKTMPCTNRPGTVPKPTTPQTRLCVLQELDPELLAFPANNFAKVGLAGHAQFEEFRHLRDVRWADLGALAGEIKNIAMHNLIILR